MSGAQSISTRRAYGVQRVCRVWHCARSSVYARRQATPSPAPCRRRGPVGAAPDDVLVAHVRRVLEASPFHGEGYRKVWAKLRVEGRRTSKERVRRLMREHDLQAPQRAGHAHGPKAHDGTITTEAPDVMWGTDMTATVTVAEGPAFVFVAVDHCTAECIGLHAAKRGTRFEALEPIRQGIRERFGGIGEGVARGLRLRHDHGSNYLADDFQQEVAFFGIESSPSFVREPEGNGVAERFIRTLKEICCGCGASRPSRNSAWPCSRSSGHTTNSGCGCWRNTTIEAPPRCDATSSGWTRQRRSEYRQTTVQEPRGSTPRPYQGLGELDYPGHDWTVTVTRCGRICYTRRKINLSRAFAGQNVGVKQVSEKIWLVSMWVLITPV